MNASLLNRIVGLIPGHHRRRKVLARLPGTVHVGNRAFCRHLTFHGRKCIMKTFMKTPFAAACFERECLADELFHDRPWFTPILKKGKNWLIMPEYPAQSRLDTAAANLSEQERLEASCQATMAAFDIFLEGYAHRDFHSANLYWVDGQVRVTDFELLEAYPAGRRPAFPQSYDLAGIGLESPFKTHNMSYARPVSPGLTLQFVLSVPLDRALDALANQLRGELLQQSKTFARAGRRHICKMGRIYGSFSLPYMAVAASDTQRDSQRRFCNFHLNHPALNGKSILDLGCHTGSMLFEAQRFGPGRCLGIEYDRAKVDIAGKIAAYNGLNNVSFFQRDIDRMNPADLDGPFDVVFCLAIEAHVQKKARLFQLLGKACSGLLVFEGNSTTDSGEVERALRSNGFRSFRHLGPSDDDWLTENNCRPMLLAWKDGADTRDQAVIQP